MGRSRKWVGDRSCLECGVLMSPSATLPAQSHHHYLCRQGGGPSPLLGPPIASRHFVSLAPPARGPMGPTVAPYPIWKYPCSRVAHKYRLLGHVLEAWEQLHGMYLRPGGCVTFVQSLLTPRRPVPTFTSGRGIPQSGKVPGEISGWSESSAQAPDIYSMVFQHSSSNGIMFYHPISPPSPSAKA
ncbi:hypothetical protein SKAU_G00197630 [Synaphobranchus kaupii]|uniref:Uncharacterized protein n=1 Tax=Synaphobranchus kaupii TaxID=118154 RepID=A0A9Q1FEX6_SYNKA|nr:hypothetical protein SKAU_G00197630 [Synaphobranchus kaupii]